MLQFKKIPAKRKNVSRLCKGDIILYREELYLFDRIPGGAHSIYTTHMETLKGHKIPITDGGDTHYDIIGFREGGIVIVINDNDNLESGDLFALNHDKQGSFIFRFERYTNNTIIAINPMNNKETRISKHLICTKLENIPF